MPNRIKPKRSYTANAVPTTSDLDTNELAINWADGKAYTKNGAGNIVSVTLGGGGGSGEDAVLRALFVPAAPTSVTATAGNASATVSWAAPTGVLAQAPVTDYVVQVSSNSGSSWTTFSDGTSTATTATITGLTNGTAYVFRVAAINGIGTGAYSTASSAVTPAAGDPLFASVALLLPMNGTGSTFTDASATPKTVTANGDATQSTAQSKFGGKSAFFTGTSRLSSSTSSAFAFGTGDFCVEMWVYPTGAGSYQTLFSTRSSNTGEDSSNVFFGFDTGTLRPIVYTNGLVLSGSPHSVSSGAWSHIAFVRDSGNISIYLNGTRIGNTSFPTSITGTNASIGLTEANQHQFSGYIDDVRVTSGSNRGYTGATITVPTAAFPDFGPISAPTSLTATGGNAQVSLAWTAPSYNGGSAITDYSVQFSSDSGSTWSTFSRTASTTASQIVAGLANGTAYVFRVAGVNANGTGTYTAASSSVTPVVPLSAPVLTRTGCDDGTVSYSWNTIATATTYRLQSNRNGSSSLGTWADVQVSGATSYSGDTGQFSSQWFRVRAENATMQSDYSSPVQANCNYNP